MWDKCKNTDNRAPVGNMIIKLKCKVMPMYRQNNLIHYVTQQP